MNTFFTVILTSLVFVIALWIAVGVRHLSTLKKNLADDFEFVDEKIRLRHDIIPILIEILRKFSVSFPEKIISTRDKARRVQEAGLIKIESEYDLSHEIKELINTGLKNSLCAKDPNFLEIKKEIENLNIEILNRSRQYNDTVLKFNSTKNIWILLPISKIMKLKQALIFQFEK